jgi:hypothetical protein
MHSCVPARQHRFVQQRGFQPWQLQRKPPRKRRPPRRLLRPKKPPRPPRRPPRQEARGQPRLHEGHDAQPRAGRRDRRQADARTEVTKKIWEYIKQHKLQDAANKRNINADAKLKEIFKKPQVTMFEMTKLVNAHLS